MGQGDVLKILEENGNWMTVNEIHEEGRYSKSSITRALNVLYRHGEVFFRVGSKNTNNRAINLWKTKK